jgi:predicted peptidase
MKKLLIITMAMFFLILSGCHRETPPHEDQPGAQLTRQPDYHPIPGFSERRDHKIPAVAKRVPSAEGDQSAQISEEDPLGFTLELKSTGKLEYYLYAPLQPQDNLPLIIYLHGSGMRLAQTDQLLTNEAFPLYLQRGDLGELPACVAIPKLTEAYQDWAQAGDEIREMIEIIHRDIGIETDRIALTGHSLGGSGAYQLAISMPGNFACIAPLSGGVACSQANLDALAKTRIWSFIGSSDTVIAPDLSRQLIAALQSMGADARITELPDATHRDLPSLAYRQSGLLDWLISGGQQP